VNTLEGDKQFDRQVICTKGTHQNRITTVQHKTVKRGLAAAEERRRKHTERQDRTGRRSIKNSENDKKNKKKKNIAGFNGNSLKQNVSVTCTTT